MIKTSYDPKEDAIFIWLAPEGAISAETKEVSPGIMLDYDASGHLSGIEALDVHSRIVANTPAQAEAG